MSGHQIRMVISVLPYSSFLSCAYRNAPGTPVKLHTHAIAIVIVIREHNEFLLVTMLCVELMSMSQ